MDSLLNIKTSLFVPELFPWKGSSYFPLPKELNNSMRRLINNKNDDNECFRWCLVRYLNHVNKSPAKIRNIDREIFENHFD